MKKIKRIKIIKRTNKKTQVENKFSLGFLYDLKKVDAPMAS